MASTMNPALIGTPGYQAVRGRLLGQLSSEPVAPANGTPGTSTAPLPTAPFAPVGAMGIPPVPQVAASGVQSAVSARLNPQVGQMRKFPNGRTGRWDGTGWLDIG